MTAPLPIQSLYRKVRESDTSALEELEERLTLWFETLCIAYYGDNEVYKRIVLILLQQSLMKISKEKLLI